MTRVGSQRHKKKSTLMKGLDTFLSECEYQSEIEHTKSYSNTGRYICAVVGPFQATAIQL
jgi:hypothetical protein